MNVPHSGNCGNRGLVTQLQGHAPSPAQPQDGEGCGGDPGTLAGCGPWFLCPGSHASRAAVGTQGLTQAPPPARRALWAASGMSPGHVEVQLGPIVLCREVDVLLARLPPSTGGAAGTRLAPSTPASRAPRPL